MLGINLKHSFATVAVAASLLLSAASASASVYQPNQTDREFLAGITDGTSNTILFGCTRNVDLAGPFVPNN